MQKRSKHIGIVMATYNGAKNLRAQLTSITRQTMLPAEMVICDDLSTDETVSILRDFEREAEFPVHISINERRLGPTENFFHAASKCRSEYIALCDQDDIWLDRKVELCEAGIDRAHPDLTLHAFTEFHLDQTGAEVVSSRFSLPSSRVVRGHATSPSTIWPGMSMVAKKNLFQNIQSMQAHWHPYRDRIQNSRPGMLYVNWVNYHDLFLLNQAHIEDGSIFLIDEVCAKHRTRDGGLYSGSSRESPPGAPESHKDWEDVESAGYKLWSLFCTDFVDYLKNIDGLGPFDQACQYYERWARLWLNRMTIHSQRTGFAHRVEALVSNVRDGAYRSKWAGGLGSRSLVKDGLRLLGIKLGHATRSFS